MLAREGKRHEIALVRRQSDWRAKRVEAALRLRGAETMRHQKAMKMSLSAWLADHSLSPDLPPVLSALPLPSFRISTKVLISRPVAGGDARN